MSKQQSFGSGATLVVGGSGGIGRAVVRELAQGGARVVFTYRGNEKAARALREELADAGYQVEARQLSLDDRGALNRLLLDLSARFGVISGIIYSAGPPVRLDYVSRLPPDSWRETFAQDAEGCFNLVHTALPILMKQRGGVLTAVTTSQVTRAEITGVLSTAPKAAIEMLFRTVAKEYAKFNIRANTVRAGWVSAGMANDHLHAQLSPAAWDSILSRIPMRRVAQPAEIAKVVAFVASNDASYMTGESITVDGGMHL